MNFTSLPRGKKGKIDLYFLECDPKFDLPWNFEASFGRKSFRNPFERVIIERLCCVRGAHTVHIWYNRKRGTCLELLVKAESRFEWKMSRNLVHQFVFSSLCEQRIGIRFYVIPFLEFTR